MSESDLQLTDQERQTIHLARQFEGLKMNPAWQAMITALKAYRDDALEAVRRSRSSNAQVRSNLLLKYEERDDTIKFIESYLKNISEARKAIIRTLAELHGHHGEAAEDLVALLEGQQ